MRVLVVAAEDSSGHYRLKSPSEALHNEDVHVDIFTRNMPAFRSKVTGVFSLPPEYDLLILQRPMSDMLPTLIDHVQAQGVAVIVEVDDDFHTVQASNIAFLQHHPKINPKANFHHFRECVKRADLVTVSTDALAKRYGQHGRVAVLRNYIPSDWLTIPRNGDGHTIGWAGTTVNHPTDLPATRGGVGEALRDHPDWHFVGVGGKDRADDVWRQLRIDPARCEVTEWRPLGVHELVMSQFDVGIAPLDDIVFNHAKSWLKGLEYAALGIPFVASDLPEYRLLRDEFGIGILARQRSKEWRRQVGGLMSSDHEDLGRMIRLIVKERLTIERNAWQWPEAWQHAIDERRRRTANTTRAPK